jgi:hypothetical protein
MSAPSSSSCGTSDEHVAYLIGVFVPVFTLGFAVLAVWLVLLAGITLPAWYWAPWKSINGVR